MDNKMNKPRVFLSHSKEDISFVQHLYDDLRRCQIDPWLDSEDIRHGQPWLDAIFESGIPTCDSILVYLTENSIQSAMVKKEIDVSIIKKLRDNRIGFLPYVSRTPIREQLRADIQALQTPEWNTENYHALLPQVVAEIWHSYLDRVIPGVANEERVKRLEAELKLEQLKQSTDQQVFSGSENADFNYIWQRLDRYEVFVASVVQAVEGKMKALEHREFRIHLQGIIADLDKIMYSEYVPYLLDRFLYELLDKALPSNDSIPKGASVNFTTMPDIFHELLMYGFLNRTQKMESPSGANLRQTFTLRTSYVYVFTEKIYRFKYWLAYHKKLPQGVKWEPNNHEALEVNIE